MSSRRTSDVRHHYGGVGDAPYVNGGGNQSRVWQLKTVAGGYATSTSGLPANAVTGRAYSGINVLLLWVDAADKGFASHRWLTFKQALDVGGNVRKGEKSTLVTLFKPFEKKETGLPLFPSGIS